MEKIDKIKEEGVINELGQLHKPIAFVLGAGASVTSDIPGADTLVRKWLEDLKINKSNSQMPLDKWATEDNLAKLVTNKSYFKGFTFERKAEWYSQIFTLRYKSDYSEGNRYLEEKMKDKEPGIGYAALSRILSETKNKIVITTNFDNLVADALGIYARGQQPLVIGHDSLTEYLDRELGISGLPRPLIAKIHGDLMLDPRNSTLALNSLPKEWKTSLTTIFENCAVLVVGYGGNDIGLMKFLSDELPRLTGNFYWCLYQNEKPNCRIKKVVKKHKGFYTKIQGFDEFMLSLAAELLKDQFGIYSLAKDIRQRAEEREKTFLAKCKKIEKIYKKGGRDLPGNLSHAFEYGKNKKPDGMTWGGFLASLNNSEALSSTYPKAIEDLEKICKNAKESCQELSEIKYRYAEFTRDTLKDYDEASLLLGKACMADPQNGKKWIEYALFVLTKLKNEDGEEGNPAEDILTSALEKGRWTRMELSVALGNLVVLFFAEEKKGANRKNNVYLQQLKTLLEKGFERSDTETEYFTIKPDEAGLDTSDSDFIHLVAGAIFDETKLENLKDDEFWQSIEPLPVDDKIEIDEV